MSASRTEAFFKLDFLTSVANVSFHITSISFVFFIPTVDFCLVSQIVSNISFDFNLALKFNLRLIFELGNFIIKVRGKLSKPDLVSCCG